MRCYFSYHKYGVYALAELLVCVELHALAFHAFFQPLYIKQLFLQLYNYADSFFPDLVHGV